MLEPYEETLTISLTRYNGLLRKSVQYDFVVDMLLESAYLTEWGDIAFGHWASALLLNVFEPEAVAEREADLKAKREALVKMKQEELYEGGAISD